ncbi:MAG TPA: ISNCY family transposase [Candidatus Limnocylindria bacterium]|nr:ISNCY family transposase [Candidatus Limnocylindria bacterium]
MAQSPPRALVLTRVIAGKVTVADAALLLGVSERTIRRLRTCLERSGPAALIHGNTGRRPAHALDPAVASRIVALAKTTYAGINDSHLTELLAEREGISVSRASVQRVLRAAGLKSPRKHTRARYRRRRERRSAAGMLVQLDGSREGWFGDERPYATLQAIIDDATGDVICAVFREQEDAAGYFELLRTMISTKGVPLAAYSDKHSIFRITPDQRETFEEELAGEREPTQFGRALAELGVELIRSNSPQARGRIERLWNTLQDRLRAELRLAGVTTIAAGNAFLVTYLPRHNARFAVVPADPTAAWRALPEGKTVESVCCFKYSRVVAQDNTVSLDGAPRQLPPRSTHWGWAGQRVEVRQHVDGSWSVHAGGRQLARSAVPSTTPKIRARRYTRAPVASVQPLPTPGATSPWRKGYKDWHPAAAKRAMIAARSRPA